MKKSILELTDNEVIHAPTLEIAEKLCKKFDELGFRWADGDMFVYDINFVYGDEQCYNPKDGHSQSLTYYKRKDYTILTIDDLSDFDTVINTQPHYDNTHGSLYQIAEQRGWNSYQFDIIKRIDRCLKKGQFEHDLQKTKDLIDLYLQESK